MRGNSKVLFLVVGLLTLALLSGCASKGYVDKVMAEEQVRSQAAMGNLENDLGATKAEIEKMQTLTAQLEKKTEMAINEAKGFENYQVIWEGEVFFAFNSSEITEEAREILDQAGDKMVADRGSVMEIAGYTDPTGSNTYNLELGNHRAAAVKYFLVDDYGVNLYRIFMVSHGEKKSVAVGDAQISNAKLRRVALKLWGKP